jgi:hypothetical protein
MKWERGSLNRRASVERRKRLVRKSAGLENQHGILLRFGYGVKDAYDQAWLMADWLLTLHRLAAGGWRLTTWACCIYPQVWASL